MATPRTGTKAVLRRRLLILVGSVLAGLLLLVGVAYFVLDPLAKVMARGFLEDTLKVPVRIRGVRILLAGGARVEGVTILNPEGYRDREAFHLESLEAVSKARVLFRNPIVITQLTIRQPEFIVEFGEKESNWATLIRNASAHVPPKDEKPKEGPPKPKDPPLGLIIRDVRILQPVIRVLPTKLFPEGLLIRLNDITLDKVGVNPEEPSPFYLAVAVLIQAVITGESSDGIEIPSALKSRLASELGESGKVFSGALAPPKP